MKRHRIASCCFLLKDIIHPHLETKSSFDLEDKTTSASREFFGFKNHLYAMTIQLLLKHYMII